MSLSLNSALTGAALGGALTYASVSQPRIILDQFSLKDMHMLRSFMTATAGSAVLTAVLSRLNLFTPYVRPPMTIKLFSRYDANIIGGLLIGTGMALTGACPGSVIPQLATGIPSAWPAFLGALAGGLLWVTGGERFVEVSDSVLPTPIKKEDSESKPPAPTPTGPPNTFHRALNISYPSMLTIYVLGCLSVVGLSTFLDRVPSDPWSGVRGGLAIAVAQSISMLSTQAALCSSGAFEESAHWLLWTVQRVLGIIDAESALPKPPPCSNAGSLFAVGEFVGAVLLAKALNLPSGLSAIGPSGAGLASTDAQIIKLFAGGVCLGFGARFAGGCTSGHGISGMSAMSMASLVTVATMFGGGIAVSALLG